MNSEIDIEETKRLVQYGVICFNENGKKLYYKPRKYSEEERAKLKTEFSDPIYELVPLTKDEMKQYGVNIEESEQQTPDGEIEIEESEHELSTQEKLDLARKASEDEKRRKASGNNLTLSGDENAVKTAKKILEDAQAKQKEGDREKEELLAENEHLRVTQQLMIEVQANKKMDKLGIKDSKKREEYLAHPERLQAYEDGLKAKTDSNAPAGSAPLNAQQLGLGSQQDQSLRTKKFPDYASMVAYLHSPSETSEEANEKEQALKELWQHGVKAWKTANRPELNVNPNELEPQTGIKEPELISDNLSNDSGQSELEKFGIHRGKGKDKRPWGSGQAQPSPQVKEKKEGSD